ncbi:hypothetical protein GA0070610_4154 [Micromonospora echinofusca]|uniref:Uncharacterized protein n=1 Tax=Micromonospora echinofusca TaxID=47858 RepID=A0A1C5GE45_MICEH|nr:hypothetical protein [Micromonospora echinofusca]SCG17832.1 hypothetical protein GA0070610_4154 [Micromonospora echinofusca]
MAGLVLRVPLLCGGGAVARRFAADGMMRIYHPSKTDTGGPVKVVLGDDWRGVRPFG